ncbi:MAG: RNA polymerase sigma factor [Pseudomonadota bacterium]
MVEPTRPSSRDGELLDALASEFAGPLHGYFLRRTGSRSDAEDLVQEVFARLARVDGVGAVENRQAYVFQIAANLLRDRARRAGARSASSHETFDDGHHGDQTPSPESQLLAREALKQVEAALHRLPAKTRRIFLLHRLDGLKYREIAETIGLAESTVEKHMMTAIAAITREVQGQGR